MSGIHLDSPVSRGTDADIDIAHVGINYANSRVLVRLTFATSGQQRDFIFEGPSLTALRNNVSQFNGLRVALLAYLQTLDNSLDGSVT